jgi:O-antigen ligase
MLTQRFQRSKPRAAFRPRRSGTRRTPWSERLKVAFDVGLFLVLAIVPLLIGGRHPIGRVAYQAIVLGMAACWLVRKFLLQDSNWRRSGFEWLWGVALFVVLLQILPLPQSLLNLLASYQQEILPTWFHSAEGSLRLGTWNTISLTPVATRDGFAMLATHATLFTLLVQRLETLDDVERALNWLAIGVISVGTVGALQYISGADRYMWVFQHPSRDASRVVTGPFINANHFAHFLSLGLGAIIVWLQRVAPLPQQRFVRHTIASRAAAQTREWQLFMLGCASIVVLVALVLSRSRGGIIVAAAACSVCVVALARAQVLGRRAAAGMVLVAVIVLAAIYLHGHQRVQQELETLVSGSLSEMDRDAARQRVWQANLEIAKHFPLFGGGVGCHAELYPLFFPYVYDVEFTHAESGYLQIVTETGFVGGALLCAAMLLLAQQGWRAWKARSSTRHASCIAAAGAGCFASGLHSIFDFPWYIPGCMAATLVLLACWNRLGSLATLPAESDRHPTSKPSLLAINLGVIWIVCLTALTLSQIPAARAAGAWNEYLRVSLAQNPLRLNEFAEAISADDESQLRKAKADQTRLMARYLQQVLARNPRDPRAHARMAYQCVRIFEEVQAHSDNAMDLISLRDAAIASQFPDRASQDRWLTAAIGENRRWLDLAEYHLYQAASYSPLQGKVYLHLSQLAFLKHLGAAETVQLLDQAKLVRPHDASVAFGIGREAAIRGDMESALQNWKLAFHLSPEYRERIIAQLAGAMNATDFVNLFAPEEDGIRMLFVYYRGTGAEDQARMIAPLLATRQMQAAEAKHGRDAARMWEKAHATFRYMENSAQSLTCAQRAVEQAPSRYQSRLLLAQELMRNESWSEAMDEVDWCLLHRPHDQLLLRMKSMATRQAAAGKSRVPKTLENSESVTR